MTVYAPDCKKDLDVYETFIKTVTNISWEGRRGGTNDFHITGDFNVELGLLSTIWERTKNTLSHTFFSCAQSVRWCCEVVIDHSLSMHLHCSR